MLDESFKSREQLRAIFANIRRSVRYHRDSDTIHRASDFVNTDLPGKKKSFPVHYLGHNPKGVGGDNAAVFAMTSERSRARFQQRLDKVEGARVTHDVRPARRKVMGALKINPKWASAHDSARSLIMISQKDRQRSLDKDLQKHVESVLDLGIKKQHPYLGQTIKGTNANGRRILGFVKDMSMEKLDIAGGRQSSRHFPLGEGAHNKDSVVTYDPKLKVLERFHLPVGKGSHLKLKSGKTISLE